MTKKKFNVTHSNEFCGKMHQIGQLQWIFFRCNCHVYGAFTLDFKLELHENLGGIPRCNVEWVIA